MPAGAQGIDDPGLVVLPEGEPVDVADGPWSAGVSWRIVGVIGSHSGYSFSSFPPPNTTGFIGRSLTWRVNTSGRA